MYNVIQLIIQSPVCELLTEDYDQFRTWSLSKLKKNAKDTETIRSKKYDL